MHKHASNKEHVAVIENEIHKVEMGAQDEWSSPSTGHARAVVKATSGLTRKAA